MLPIEQIVQDVEQFDTNGTPALSLYLDIPRAGGRELEAEAASVLDALASAVADDRHSSWQLARSVHRALSAIPALQPTPHAVAAFVCPDRCFVRVVPLPEPVGPSAHFGPELRLGPLLAALDEHETTVVALVDREHARIFRVFLGQIEETAQVQGGSGKHGQSGRSKEKAWRNAGAIRMGVGERNLERRDDWHVRRHLERTLAAMRPNGDRVLLGGGLETVQELARLLPKRVRHRTRIMCGLSLDASIATVLERVLETQWEAEREEEEELIDNLTERDRSRAVFGAAAVAEAVCDGRVHTLAYGASTTFEAGECLECGWLVAGAPTEVCGRCGGKLEPKPDLVERLVERVHRAGGRVEEVRGRARQTLLRSEGLAALLRYVPKTPSPPGSPDLPEAISRRSTAGSR